MSALRTLLPLLGIGLVAAMPFVTASCSKKACFQWTELEGTCPAQEDALAFFEGSPECGSNILSVDSAPDFDGELCCYDVTSGDRSEVLCGGGVGSSVSTGVGTSTPPPSTGPGPMPGCFSCPDGAFGGAFPLCDQSTVHFDNLMNCICAGPCAAACVNGGCSVPINPDGECSNCIQDFELGCGLHFENCLNDPGQF